MSNAFDLTVKALREQGLNSDEILEELSQLFQQLVDSNKKIAPEESMEGKIRRLLKDVGMPAHIKGYDYWTIAIQLYKKSGKENIRVGEIYKGVAEMCNSTINCVERAMKLAVQRVLDRCSQATMKEVFGANIERYRGEFTNLEFLAIMAELV